MSHGLGDRLGLIENGPSNQGMMIEVKTSAITRSPPTFRVRKRRTPGGLASTSFATPRTVKSPSEATADGWHPAPPYASKPSPFPKLG